MWTSVHKRLSKQSGIISMHIILFPNKNGIFIIVTVLILSLVSESGSGSVTQKFIVAEDIPLQAQKVCKMITSFSSTSCQMLRWYHNFRDVTALWVHISKHLLILQALNYCALLLSKAIFAFSLISSSQFSHLYCMNVLPI